MSQTCIQRVRDLNKFLSIFYVFCSEVVGYIENIDGPKLVGNQRKFKIFKFMLNNNAGKYVQCLVWGDDKIEAVRDKIQLNKVSSVVLFVFMYIPR